MPRFVEVAKRSQIPASGAIAVEVEGRCLALVNLKKTAVLTKLAPCPKGTSLARKSSAPGTGRASTSRPAMSPGTQPWRTSQHTRCA